FLGTANLGDRLHVRAAFKQFHAERDRAKLQEAFQLGCHLANRLRHEAAPLTNLQVLAMGSPRPLYNPRSPPSSSRSACRRTSFAPTSRPCLRKARIAPGERTLEPFAACDLHELRLVGGALAFDGKVNLKGKFQGLEHTLSLQRPMHGTLGLLDE